ncbi:type III-B CRISPR module RAMP protein Cmr4 [Aureispira sp. CCB-E]|uniref:type III-B CRISPR module RAMP protein Cmr4 n=1 Tax=Aureispira sp. CCB-E TaxID=3051121 RepID=UPI002869026C|nr:type III-B CRISPR module RAMP protein Cmr4 [Aureispira sp. CCB-E]WMX17570.1 type III-B CRISPR module RAMP protein Cmr4 [Aureispira sp. CCB-E]
MYKHANPLFLICETPLHAGSGSDLGIVDLPIQRERHTSFPKIEGSSLKGALREAFENKVLDQLKENKIDESFREKIKELNKIFGFDNAALKGFPKEEMDKLFAEKEKEFAGCLGISDARLFLFPVKSMKGVFAWITCPKVLRQFEMDMKGCFENFSLDGIPSFIIDNECYTQGEALLVNDKYVILEEYTFENKSSIQCTVKNNQHKDGCFLGEWLVNNNIVQANSYWEEKIKSSIVILSDDAFKDFVNLSTEVITRNKINNITGTAADTGLFTEEYLPAESILYSMILAAPEFKKDGLSACQVVDFFTKIPNVVQIGGSATLGKGITRTQFLTSVSDKECKQEN